MSVALRYHQATKYHPATIGNHPGIDWEAQPEATKSYASEAPVRMAAFLPLDPNPFTGEPASAAATAAAGISLAGLSRLIYAAYGVTGVIQGQARPTYLRAAPSAGGLYPAELYVVVRSFAGLAPGLYGYQPLTHALIPLWEEESVAIALGRACYGNAQVTHAGACLVITGVFERSRWRYHERAYRRVLLDSGHLIGNALLVAPELGLQVGLTAAFCDERLAAVLRLDPAIEGPLAVLPVQAPGPSERPAWSALPSAPLAAAAQLGEATLAAVHAASVCGPERPRQPALGDEMAQSLHARHGWHAGISLIDDLNGTAPVYQGIANTIARRRSTRDYTGAGMPRDALARILMTAYRPEAVSQPQQPALARDLLMTFIAVVNVADVPDGIYYLAPEGIELRLVCSGNKSRELQYLCLGQELGGNAAVVIFHAADLAAAVALYGDRAYRYLHLDAGIIGQRLNLAAISEGLGASGIGGFFDDEITQLLGIPTDQAVVYVTTIGHPG